MSPSTQMRVSASILIKRVAKAEPSSGVSDGSSGSPIYRSHYQKKPAEEMKDVRVSPIARLDT